MSEPRRLRASDDVSEDMRELLRSGQPSRSMTDSERLRHRRRVARIAAAPVAASLWLGSTKLWATLLGAAVLGMSAAYVAVVRAPTGAGVTHGTSALASNVGTRPNSPPLRAPAPMPPARAARTVAPVADVATAAPSAPASAPRNVAAPATPRASATSPTDTTRHASAPSPRSSAPNVASSLAVVASRDTTPAVAATSGSSEVVARPAVANSVESHSTSATASTATPSASASTAVPGSSLAGIGAPVGDTLAQETQSMIRAHAALASQPGAALALVEEMERAHPHSQFFPERQYIAIHALRRLGRADDARARARTLVTMAPRSPQAVAARRLFPDLP